MQKFYKFLNKEEQIANINVCNTHTAKQFEIDFLIHLTDFIENNICYWDEDGEIKSNGLTFQDHYLNFENTIDNLISTNKHKKSYIFSKRFYEIIGELKLQSKENFLLKNAIKDNFCKEYTPMSDVDVNIALYNLLYCSMPEKIATSTYNLLRWIKQTKLNLKLDENIDSNRFLLQYSSRDINDDRSKGGSGKSYILDGIRFGLNKIIKNYIKFGNGMFPSNNFIDTIYSKNLFVIDEEMPSLKDINFPALKTLLTSNYYRAEEKGKMGQQLKNIANFIGASNQNYKDAFDSALSDRIYEIICDSRLNLRNDQLFDQVSSYLPSKNEIGNSFIFLINLNEQYLDKLIAEYKQKYIIEKNNAAYNKNNLFLVNDILNYVKSLSSIDRKAKPKDIADWLNEKRNKKYTINKVIQTLIFMKDKLEYAIEGQSQNPYRKWNFENLNIEQAEDNVEYENESSQCIFENRQFFKLENI